jgi:hypothetical protein
VTLRRRADGSGRLEGECTPELAEHLDVVFDALAGPKPAQDGAQDPRTAAQRRHDALLDAFTYLARTDALPNTGGVQATIVLTMSEQSYLTGTGLALTSHGALIPAREALRWAGADHRILGVMMNSMKAITAYSSTHRTFTEQQRLAIFARDLGCSFPGCDAPPGWTQIHHITDWAHGGPTSIDNGTLICRNDHRNRIREGWRAEMINGRVGWKPPPHIDPDQKPRFNTLHIGA